MQNIVFTTQPATQPTSSTAARPMSLPNLLLRVESLALFVATLAVYGAFSGDWLAFILLLFVPDFSAIGYLINPRIGAIGYNLAHNFAAPVIVFALGWAVAAPAVVSVGIIWAAHISMDRVVGYGLKYPSAFKQTHMQRV